MSGFRHNPPATPVTVKLELPCLLWMGWPRACMAFLSLWRALSTSEISGVADDDQESSSRDVWWSARWQPPTRSQQPTHSQRTRM